MEFNLERILSVNVSSQSYGQYNSRRWILFIYKIKTGWKENCAKVKEQIAIVYCRKIHPEILLNTISIFSYLREVNVKVFNTSFKTVKCLNGK